MHTSSHLIAPPRHRAAPRRAVRMVKRPRSDDESSESDVCDEESEPDLTAEPETPPAHAHPEAYAALKEAARACSVIGFRVPDHQPNISLHAYRQTVDWLLFVSNALRYEPYTFFLAAQLFARYLAVERIMCDVHIQLYAVTCLWVAAKLEEVARVDAELLICFHTYGVCNLSRAVKAERRLLTLLGYEVTRPTVYHFLPAYDWVCSDRVRRTAMYLAHVSCFSNDLLREVPHAIAATCVFLSVLAHDGAWTSQLRKVDGFEHAALRPMARRLLNTCFALHAHDTVCARFDAEHGEFIDKVASQMGLRPAAPQLHRLAVGEPGLAGPRVTHA